MNDLQAKFAITLIALGFFFAYAVPLAKQAKRDHDAVIRQVGQTYVAPNPDVSTGDVSLADAQK